MGKQPTLSDPYLHCLWRVKNALCLLLLPASHVLALTTRTYFPTLVTLYTIEAVIALPNYLNWQSLQACTCYTRTNCVVCSETGGIDSVS